jgi:hypothetical protein
MAAREADGEAEADRARELRAFSSLAAPPPAPREALERRLQRLDRLGVLALAAMWALSNRSPVVVPLAAAVLLAPPAAWARWRVPALAAVDLVLAAALARRDPGFTPRRLRRPPSASAAVDAFRLWMGSCTSFTLLTPLFLPLGSPVLVALLHVANQWLTQTPAVCASPLARGHAGAIAAAHDALALAFGPLLLPAGGMALAGADERCEALVAFVQAASGLLFVPCVLVRAAHPALRLAVRRRGALGALDAALAARVRRATGLLQFYCMLPVVYVLSCHYARLLAPRDDAGAPL